MRTAWIAIALAAISPARAAMPLTVYIASASGACPYAAKRIATGIFQSAGIAIQWRTTPATNPPPGLRIELVDNTPDERLPGSLAVAYPYCGCSKSITVFLDRVRALARDPGREPALLAYVLVHEITHVLQGIDRHSDAGVMKARWDGEDRAAIYERRLPFLDEDLELLRQGLASGACRKPNAVTEQSGSGIAVRPG